MNRFFKVSMVVVLAMVISMAVMAEGCGGGCCLKMKDVKVVLANIDNGVTITYTTGCPVAKKALQEKLTKCEDTKACELCGMRGVTRDVKMTDTGAVMTLTAKNSRKVKMLQEKAADEVSGKGCAGAKEKGCSAEQQKKCAASQGK